MISLSADELHDLHTIRGLPAMAIAQLAGCSDRAVRRRLRALGVPTRPQGLRGSCRPHDQRWSLARRTLSEDLRTLYIEGPLTTTEIGTRLGCSANTVARWLRTLGVPIRPRGPRVSSDRLARWKSPTEPASWSPEIAYAVGLIATDGNLSGDGRHLCVTSKDVDLLETLRQCLGLRPSVAPHSSGFGGRCYHVQWGDRGFYDWLTHVGLKPAKSLTLGPLSVPDACVPDFLRGCIDGDGSVVIYTDRYHARKNERYVYQRLVVSLVSASGPFLEWIRDTILRLRGFRGSFSVQRSQGRSPIWRLKYGKRASLNLLAWVYYAPSLPCLARKRDKAMRFLQDPERPRQREQSRVESILVGLSAGRRGVTRQTRPIQNRVPARA